MPKPIVIVAGSLRVEAELNDTPCAQALAKALPIRGRANLWGEEIYFRSGVACGLDEGARETLAVGELAYWPPGQAFCIFLGPTPASEADEPRAASEVNPIGQLERGVDLLLNVQDGQPLTIEAAP